MDYKDKLRLAKEALDSGSYDKETIEYIFPELAESEDERIRKHLIGVVELYYGNTDEQEKKDCLAWLEKQSKDSPVFFNSSNIGKDEQKPAWKPSDEQMDILQKLCEHNSFVTITLTKEVIEIIESLYQDLKKLK